MPLASAPTPCGPDELARDAARLAERAQRGAADVEHVDPVAARVGHERPPRGVDREPARILQLPAPGAERAPARAVRVRRRRAVADDAVVGVVGDEHAARRVDGDVVGIAELARARPRPVPTVPMKPPPRSKIASRWLPVVGHDQPRAADRQPLRALHRPRRHDHRGAVPSGGEALDAVVARVGDVDRARRPIAIPPPAPESLPPPAPKRNSPSSGAARAPRVQQASRRPRSGRSGRRRRRRRPSRRRRPRPPRPS